MKTLIDAGFDTEFSYERIKELSDLFANQRIIEEYIMKMHLDDNTFDMKRGDFYPEILRCIVTMKSVLAKAYALTAEQCHPNFGSNGSIDTILTAIKLREINKGIDTSIEGGMLVATPTYFRNYSSAQARQIRMIKVPLKKNWDLDIDLFLQKLAKEKPTVVFLVSPNNPTGIPIKDEAIIKIIDNSPSDTLVVIDRTLINTNAEISSTDLLKRFAGKQLAILHSFSKYLGISHLRVGFALYTNEQVANEIASHLPLGLCIEGAVKGIRSIIENNGLKPLSSIIDNIVENKKIISAFCLKNKEFGYTDFAGNYCLLLLPKTSFFFRCC